MKSKVIAALLIAATTSFAVPAFASGYGPAPFYRPSVGAPASQHGQNAQTVAAERHDSVGSVNSSYGGVVSSTSESGVRHSDDSVARVYNGH